jgi:hypothetical protein
VIYFNLKEGEQEQHKFWILGAICDILSASIKAKLINGTSIVDVGKVGSVLMDLLRN